MISQCGWLYSAPQIPGSPENVFIFLSNGEVPESFRGGAGTSQTLLLSFLPRVCFTELDLQFHSLSHLQHMSEDS